MMIATWRGTSPWWESISGAADLRSLLINKIGLTTARFSLPSVHVRRRSNRHQLLFLFLQHAVDFCNHLVGQLLDLLLATAGVVLGQFLILEQFLDIVVGITTDIADCHARALCFGDRKSVV